MALRLFEELLAQRPGDVGAQRGRVRSLLRLAEAYDRVGDRQKVQEVLRAALAAEPSLTQDPDFTSWRWRPEVREVPKGGGAQAQAPRAEEGTGRLLRLGLGLDVLGSRGELAVVGSAIFLEHWAVHLGVDPRGPGLDVGLRLQVPLRTLSARVSPWEQLHGELFFGLGRHLSFADLGLPARADEPVWGRGYSYQQLYGRTVHLDGGLQFVHTAGPLLELGLGLVATSGLEPEQTLKLVPVLDVGVGWRFQ
jgi:hypothetical protein